MPIDLVIDEREGGKEGDSNNNANRSTADSTSHTDGASTPDMVSNISTYSHRPVLGDCKGNTLDLFITVFIFSLARTLFVCNIKFISDTDRMCLSR